MILPYPAQFPTTNGKIGSFTQIPCNNQLPSTIQIQSIDTKGFQGCLRSHVDTQHSFQHADRLAVHTETRAVGMYKELHQKRSPEIGI